VYETFVSSLVVVAVLFIVHLIWGRTRVWLAARKEAQAQAVQDWYARENAEHQHREAKVGK
jgi:hypothetical protein